MALRSSKSLSHLGLRLGAAVSDYDGWQEENEEGKGKAGGERKGRDQTEDILKAEIPLGTNCRAECLTTINAM